MKTIFKTMAIAVVAALAGLGACTKDAANGTDGGKTTGMSLKLSESAVSRTLTTPAEVASVTFNSGYVLFTNGVGSVIKVTRITDKDATVTEEQEKAGTHVKITSLVAENGGTIQNVPAASENVYIVGNLPATGVTAPAVGENISAVQDRVIKIETQSAAAGVTAVTLYGEADGGIKVATGTVPENLAKDALYATVDVNAIAARIEIGAVSYKNETTKFVTAFKVDGIFVNYYYPEMSLASEAMTARVNNAPADNAEADTWYTGGSAKYTSTLAALYDYKTAASLGYAMTGGVIGYQANNPAAGTDKNVWAYNVLAPKTFDGDNVTALEAPHIIIRLSDVMAKIDETPGDTYPTTQYLTVKEFRKAGSETKITKFEPGYIYYITNLTFDESKLGKIPERESVTVYVEAKLMTWTRQEIEWGW